MNIVVDGLTAKIGGGVTYLKNLMLNMVELAPQHKFYIFLKKELESEFRQVNSSDKHNLQVISFPIHNKIELIFYEFIVMPFILRKIEADLVYCPADIAPLLVPCHLVIGVQHQFIYYPEVYNRLSIYNYLMKFIIKRSLKKADGIICISESLKKRLKEYFKINEEKISVIYHGTEFKSYKSSILCKNPELQAIISDNRKIILSVSTIAPHKNYEVLLEAYSMLDKEYTKNYKVVIVGKRLEPYFSKLVKICKNLNISQDIIFTDFISFEALEYLYRNSVLFVFPSLLEGFGLPPLEAMYFGIPVLSSNSPAMPEILGDAAIYFDPYNPLDLKEKIKMLLENNKIRDDLITRGYQRVSLFSWQRCALETLKFFEKITEENEFQ
jgi:glycosyltransferase involved in cell wall biosynthesis